MRRQQDINESITWSLDSHCFIARYKVSRLQSRVEAWITLDCDINCGVTSLPCAYDLGNANNTRRPPLGYPRNSWKEKPIDPNRKGRSARSYQIFVESQTRLDIAKPSLVVGRRLNPRQILIRVPPAWPKAASTLTPDSKSPHNDFLNLTWSFLHHLTSFSTTATSVLFDHVLIHRDQQPISHFSHDLDIANSHRHLPHILTLINVCRNPQPWKVSIFPIINGVAEPLSASIRASWSRANTTGHQQKKLPPSLLTMGKLLPLGFRIGVGLDLGRTRTTPPLIALQTTEKTP